MGEKLLSHVKVQSHPSVFIFRCDDGNKRNLINEMGLAEYLQDKRGFRILDIPKADVPTILATRAEALRIYGILTLTADDAILIFLPPDRFVYSVYSNKLMVDQSHQHL